MVKIWEVDFTVFSGSYPQDNVGTQHLSTISGTPHRVLLPEFTVRSGVEFYTVTGTYDSYDLIAASATNARFSPTHYSKRSFVAWFYAYDLTSFRAPIWGENSVNDNIGHGIQLETNNLVIRKDGSSVYTSTSGLIANYWHNIVITIDKAANQMKMYLDGTERLTTTAPTTNYTSFAKIGDQRIVSPARESTVALAYTATYDHVLSPAEITLIMDTGLLDVSSPSTYPYATVSGIIFGIDYLPLAGAKVFAYNYNTLGIVASSTSTSSGVYTLNFESAGNYAIGVTKSGVVGGRVVQVTVTGGVVTFD